MELWGLGDVALAIPFLRAAQAHTDVTLLAKPHAAPLLARFAPGVRHLAVTAPWTSFTGKYRLWRWPWGELRARLGELRHDRFDVGVSARVDPRDHVLLGLAGTARRLGFPRSGSRVLLTQPLPPPRRVHRAAHWQALATTLGWEIPAAATIAPGGRRVLIHTGAAQPVRRWPLDRYEQLAARLTGHGWEVRVVDDRQMSSVEQLVDALTTTDRFIGNDSGPGHVAALLGIPTFTVFGPQLPELFAPEHPRAGWLAGGPCPYKPCFDHCRYAEPHCLLSTTVDRAAVAIQTWLEQG